MEPALKMTQKTRPGRPKNKFKLVLDEKAIKMVETLAGYGLTLPEVAGALGICENSLNLYRSRNKEFDEAWLRGKYKAKGYVGGKLMANIAKGDLPSIKWFEQTRYGYSERFSTTNDTTVRVEPLEEYLRRIKNVPEIKVIE